MHLLPSKPVANSFDGVTTLWKQWRPQKELGRQHLSSGSMVPMMLQQIVGQKAVAEEVVLIHMDLPRVADTIRDFLYAVRSPDGR